MRCNGAIFDLDGTLADTLEDITAATNSMLDSFGYPTYPPVEVAKMVGQGARRLIEMALPTAEQERVDEALRRFREIYAANLLNETLPYPEVPEMLEALQNAGIKLAVLSNKPHDLTVRIVESLFRRVEFVSVIGQRQGIPRKPNPASAFEIAAKLKVSPMRCALVGDTQYDMEAGRNAGMLPIGVLWGFHDEENLREAGAALIAPTPDDLARILLD